MEGIIQKVFNNYRNAETTNYRERAMLKILQQELVEEIKKTFPDTWCWNNPIDNTWITIHTRQLVKKLLIGDTE